MNEDVLRMLLGEAAVTCWDDEVRTASAVFAGRELVRRRHRRRLASGTAAMALVGGVGFALLDRSPAQSTATTQVALDCSPDSGTARNGLAAQGLSGVTVSVLNRTGSVLPITAGSATALAFPGTSEVTLPLAPGATTLRCGGGAPVHVTVRPVLAANCVSVSAALDASVDNGPLADLTRDRLGNVPPGATVTTTPSTSPRQHVQVRAGGTLVAEAIWHQMPGAGDWHLESIARCH